MQRALDFSKTPALAVPLPFFLNAPAFALLAGILPVLVGPEIFTTRWAPATLALTHVWTLGVLGSVMLGALLQILAVACNVTSPAIPRLARTVHALLTAGTLALLGGLLWQLAAAWWLAGSLLAAAFGLYLGVVAQALWHSRAQVYTGAREILVPVRGALLALGMTVLIGLVLVIALALHRPLPAFVAGHVIWGLLGWGGLLLAGMTFQLLPIFQLTELYPKRLIRAGPYLILLLLILWTAHAAIGGLSPGGRTSVEALLGLAYCLWAGTTLQRLNRRKRPSAEPTTLFWYTSMASLIASFPVAMWAILASSPRFVLMAGVLILVGVLGSAVQGMLYKILPFLLWTHAQDALADLALAPDLVRRYRRTMPHMADYLVPNDARCQWALHVGAILSGVAACGWPAITVLAGALQTLSAAALTVNFWRALALYRQTGQRTAQLPGLMRARENRPGAAAD